MGFYIMLCAVHTTQRQGTGSDGFLYYTMYCTHYTGTGNDGILYYAMYCTHYTETGNWTGTSGLHSPFPRPLSRVKYIQMNHKCPIKTCETHKTSTGDGE